MSIEIIGNGEGDEMAGSRLIRSVGSSIFCGALFAQTVPVNIPKTLYECDLLSGLKNCAVWTWNGQEYEGSWPSTGTAGIMSVEKMDATGVLIHRVDKGGSLSGLHADYRGKWNGVSITDGQVTFARNGISGVMTWTATTEPPRPDSAHQESDSKGIPVLLDRFSFGGNSGRYVVTNLSHAALTAYAVQGARASGQGWTHIEDFRIRLASGLALGQKQLGEEIWNNFEYPRGMVVTAAIFADGSARGDRHLVDSIMAKRKEQLYTYAAMSRAICVLASRPGDVNSILSQLAAKKGDYVHSYPDRKYTSSGGEEAYTAVTRGLSENAKNGTEYAVRTTLGAVNDLSAWLRLDPVRDGNGRLFLEDATQSYACKLP